MPLPLAEILALLTALCWAIAPLIVIDTARRLGAIPFNRWRMVLMSLILVGLTLPLGLDRWLAFDRHQMALLFLSGLVGIFIGDSALFVGLSRLGPRLSSMVFSTHAPMTVMMGVLFLAEAPTLLQLAGIILVFIGVVVAILYGKKRDELHHWETVRGALRVGVCFSALAALGQATGAIIARPVMTENPDLLIASTIRIAAAALCYLLILPLPFKANRPQNPVRLKDISLITLGGFIGMVVGMTLYLAALQHGEVGIVASLSSTTPVMILPLLWLVMRRRPVAMAWVGGILACIGTALLF